MESIYPKDWPRCPSCGDFALDGHITCGRLQCKEGDERQNEQDKAAFSPLDGP
jgi:hypothetical protein